MAVKHLAYILLLLSLCACARHQNDSPVAEAPGGSPSPTPATQASVAPTLDTPIRKIDFHNFTYPSFWKHGSRFALKDGRYVGATAGGATEPVRISLIDSVYGDVTGDGTEDAMLVLSESVKGSAIPYYVYVYSIHRDQAMLLWFFETGDRAQGGLRRVFSENGKLVIELYGKDTYLGGDIFGGSPSACCPSHYTRSRYEWKDKRFRRYQQFEVFPTEGGAPYLKSEPQ
jgi:hypothetical protein